jgi:hypothetical protein
LVRVSDKIKNNRRWAETAALCFLRLTVVHSDIKIVRIFDRNYKIITVLDYGLDDWGFKSWEGLGIFLFTIMYRLALVPTQPPIQ